MSNIIPVIPTVHNGYTFRSRLEARWSVYFDKMKIDWEYEPEGYDINGRWYLPDFYFPTFGCFGEIKPTQERNKDLYLQFPSVVNKSIILFEGTPWNYVAWWFGFVGSSGCSDDNANALRRCHFMPPNKTGLNFHNLIVESLEHDVRHCNERYWWQPCGKYDGCFDLIDNRTTIGLHHVKTDGKILSWDEFDKMIMTDNNPMTPMRNAAKSARFEYGQSGTK